MNGVRNAGFAKSKLEDLKTGNYTTVNSEDIGNIVHYLRKFGADAPTPVFLYVAKNLQTPDGNFRLFMKATNMPHTKQIYMDKLTPYSKKYKQQTDGTASIDARGYGAILPFLYIGGQFYIQFKNEENKWEQIYTNIEQWKADAMEDKLDIELTKPVHTDKFLPGMTKYWESEEIWGSEIINVLKENNIQTCEVSIDPTFNNNEDLVENKNHFENFLEGIQTQFEDLIIENKIIVKGFFHSKVPGPIGTIQSYAKWTLPYNFIRKALTDIPVPDNYLSCYGINNLMDKYKLTFYSPEKKESNTTTLYWRYDKQEGGSVYGKFDYLGYVQSTILQSITPFRDDFSITYGHIREEDQGITKKYCKYLVNLTKEDSEQQQERQKQKHPLSASSIETFADGCLVNINGYRTTLRPIAHGLSKVANQPDQANGRLTMDIYSDEIKRTCFHAQDWKDKSTFQRNSIPRSNPLLFAIECMFSIMKKLATSGDRSEKNFIRLLNSKGVAEKNTRDASFNGNMKETRINNKLREQYSMANVIVGDLNIKKEILEKKQGEPGFQAVDTLLQFEEQGIWAAIQTKTGARDKPDSIHDFILTFRAIRDKALMSGCRTFGILLHYTGLKSAECVRMLANEMGVFLLSKEDTETTEQFEARVLNQINTLLYYY